MFGRKATDADYNIFREKYYNRRFSDVLKIQCIENLVGSHFGDF